MDWSGPCSVGRLTKAVWSPWVLAAVRSALCAATIMHSAGFKPSASHARVYASGAGLYVRTISEPRIMSQENWLYFARLTVRARWPFDCDAQINRFLSRSIPAALSDQQGSRCHAIISHLWCSFKPRSNSSSSATDLRFSEWSTSRST